MKKTVLTLITSLLVFSISVAQIPEEAFPLTNSMHDLWHNGNTDKAIVSSLELYRLYPPFFIDNIHHTLAQQLENDPKLYGHTYLEQLFLKNNEEINKIISPIYFWSKAINAKNEEDLKQIGVILNGMLADTTNYKAQTERYSLLILQELDKKNAIDAVSKEKILRKNILNLKAYQYINQIPSGRSEGEKRAWHRYLLAYSYDYLYRLNLQPNSEEYLQNASNYSPDLSDRQFSNAYFYDASVLTGNTKHFGFQTKYLKYLISNNRNIEALDLLSSITFNDPTDKNIKSLREQYENSKNIKPFSEYWRTFINKMGKPAPKIKIKFENETLDLTNKTNNWIYIDVWGTWCSPCVKELPALQAFFEKNKNNTDSNIKIYTFSFKSQNLKDFLNKNSYTFPVSEIDKQTNDLFEVLGYPTKLLISPDGYFIQIPFNTDWKMYLKNYTLM